ncbi:MAG: NAD(P)/FAD-dependent oxidoreductase [Rhizobiales bacterium]|nr:NAD(P)/FAD-dependent oxidoreductase [Hyphomicrobiales bacterium]
MSDFDCVIAGAGVVGLAIAKALAERGHAVLVVEKEEHVGTGISARNSEVIHAGLYYPPGSLKARFCIEGRDLLYDYCAARGVPHRRVGKLLVAVEAAQAGRLDAIRDNAQSSGVDDLVPLTQAEALALEPELHCVAALLSPSTGIVDVHSLMLALQGDAEAGGAVMALRTSVERVATRRDGVTVTTRGADGEGFDLEAGFFINAVGLDAPALARRIDDLPAERVPPAYLARGHYFTLSGRSPFSRLVYPMPVEGGLGIHLTLDLAGSARFGPDVEWIDTVDYSVDPARGALFAAEIRRYWPALDEASLQPGYAGIRPKISGPGEAAADFRIEGPADHGAGPIVNLFGIESPGLTASLAIAQHVADLVDAAGGGRDSPPGS